MTFRKWLATYLLEAEIDLDEYIDVLRPDGSTGSMPIGFITAHVEATGPETRAAFKAKVVAIDFRGGDVRRFLAHIAKALWSTYDEYIAVV